MKKHITKKTIAIISLALLILITVGTTLALVFTNTKPVENTFKPSKVSCAVVENGSTTENVGNIVYFPDDATKSDVKIKNTGDTDAFIRVAVVVNWMSEDGTKVWAQKPIEDTDYTITYNLSEDGWFDGGDGFYYYSKAVSPTAPNNLTDILINNAALKSSATVPVGTDNTKYYLSIEIVASAIQSTPTDVVSNQWGIPVNDDGELDVSNVASTEASE